MIDTHEVHPFVGKLAIYTLNIKARGDGKNIIKPTPKIYDICIESMRQYAKRIRVDLIVRHKVFDRILSNEDDHKNVIMEKFYIRQLLKYYDRVLYIDADVYINENAPNIFRYYPDESQLYIYNEVCFNNVNYDNQIKKIIKDRNISWEKNKNGHFDFYNAGVMLVNKAQANIFLYNEKEYFKFDDLPYIIDEPYLQYNIYKYGVFVTELDERFNTMAYFKKTGWFTHFANVQNRDEMIEIMANENVH